MSEMENQTIVEDNAAVLDEEFDETTSSSEEQQPDPKERMLAILEGLLFLCGDDGLSIEQAAASMDATEEYVTELFDELQKYYLQESRGIEIARFGEKYRFLSKAAIHDAAKKLFQTSTEAKLSNAALETLAIIAYKQPITRVEIEEIRGVGADVMLRKLVARGLIQEDGRSEAAGRPILYSVTDEFLDSFKLLSLDELPELPQFCTEETDNGELFHS